MHRSATLAALAVVLLAFTQGAAAACSRGKNGCAQCKNGLCTVCQSGWARRSAGFCVKCTGANCVRCDALKPAICNLCKPGSYLKNGVCKPCTANCIECANVTGKCLKCKPAKWNIDAYSWAPAYGLTDNGLCRLCTPQGPHAGWCQRCDGDQPNRCTKCVDVNNGFPMFVDSIFQCSFCTNIIGCLACRNGDGACTKCDKAMGYESDGAGGCKEITLQALF